MKKLSFVTLCSLLFLMNISCKKAVQNTQQDLVVKAITDGIWMVDTYVEVSTDITTDFLNYDFKFNADGTVTGTRSGVSSNGTWIGSAADYSITSNFPTAGAPLQKLNGYWKITDSYWDYVEAEMTVTGGKNILHLRKKP
ncbi:MAG: hypothetical protein IPP79_00450 [Chitinophagaceae bacterium]|nr:hypothetical protein [Chitinophagaceae bacterium]